ncbi:MAG: hypothetical protein HZB16_10095 [Armatimonadetes bacterium]|nr:hypothetical protein [Armatimonadota bacterium]
MLALLLLVVIGLWRLLYDRQTVLLTAAGLSVRHEYRFVGGRREVTWADVRSVLLTADGAVVEAGQARLHLRSSLRGFGGLVEQLRARLDGHTPARGSADAMPLSDVPGTELRPGVPSAWWWLVALVAYLASGVLTVPHRLPVTMWPVLTALRVVAVVPAMCLLPSTLACQRARFASLRATALGLAVAASIGRRPTLVPWAEVGPCIPLGRRFILRTAVDDFWVDPRWPGAKDILRVVDRLSDGPR